MSPLAISRYLSGYYDDVNREEVDKRMPSLDGKAYNKTTLQRVAHYALSQDRLSQPTPVNRWCRSHPTGVLFYGFRIVW
jgi:hypothetical protein